jgi:PhnB protein
MKTSHIYPGAAALNAYITVKGCGEAIEFYKKAFNATERLRLMLPTGVIGHAELEIEGALLMLSEENLEWGNKSPDTIGGNPVSLQLYVKDVDRVFQRVLDAGATVTMPVEDMFYGDRVGSVIDPFGYKWMIATHKKDVPTAEMQKLSDEMFAAMAGNH